MILWVIMQSKTPAFGQYLLFIVGDLHALHTPHPQVALLRLHTCGAQTGSRLRSNRNQEGVIIRDQ
jgi:hypothetical protein